MSKIKNLTGQTFGRLTALERVGRDKYGKARWLCQCTCGTEVTVAQGALASGHTKSCGCLNSEMVSKRRRKDITGQVFGRLTALESSGINKRENAIWRCRCTCGNEVNVIQASLASGNTSSCGCIQKEITSKRSRKNITGQVFGRLTALESFGNYNNKQAIWKCRCSCGKEVNVVQASLARGATRSCGCLSLTSNSERQFLNKLESLIGEKIVRQFCISSSRGRRYYDGYISSINTLIEVDSTYWHSSPKLIENDKFKTQLAKDNRYKLIRIIINTVDDVDNALNKVILTKEIKWPNTLVPVV